MAVPLLLAGPSRLGPMLLAEAGLLRRAFPVPPSRAASSLSRPQHTRSASRPPTEAFRPRSAQGGNGKADQDRPRIHRPEYVSSVQRQLWNAQVDLSKQLRDMAAQVQKRRDSLLTEHGQIDKEGYRRWVSSADAEGNRAWAKVQEMVNQHPVEVWRSIVLYNQRIDLAWLAGKRTDAFRLYNELKRNHLAPTAVTLTIMLQGLSRIARQEDEQLLGNSTFAEQTATIKHDLLQLHINAAKLWVPPSKRRLSGEALSEAEAEHEQNLRLLEMSNAALSASEASIKTKAARQRSADELLRSVSSLSAAYAAYLALVSRTTLTQPAHVWQAYEALRRGVGRPDGISEFDFARPIRDRAIFSSMLWGIFRQTSSQALRISNERAVKEAEHQRILMLATHQTEHDDDDAPRAHESDVSGGSSSPFGQARQLWLDLELMTEQAERRGVPHGRLRVDEKLLYMFLDYFGKCNSPAERAFAKHVENSRITRHLRRSS